MMKETEKENCRTGTREENEAEMRRKEKTDRS